MKKTILFFLFISFFNLINAQVPSYIPINNLIGWWPFNNNANDESGNGLNGSLLNGVTVTTDRFGNANSAYSFDGIDDRIYINNSFFNNGWTQYTFSCWVYLSTVGNTNNMNSSNFVLNTSPHNGICFGANWGSSGKYSLFAGNGSWDGVFNGKSTQNVTVGNWQFLTLTKNGSSFNIYVNGVLDVTWTSSVTISSTNYEINFGATDPAAGSNEVLKGKLDDIGIWDRELTPTEISVVYESNPTAIKESNIESNFCAVYPNPASQNLVIDINNSFFQKINNEIDVTVYSVDGKLVKSDRLKKNELQSSNKFNVESLSKGLYFLKLKSGNHQQTLKFIKE